MRGKKGEGDHYGVHAPDLQSTPQSYTVSAFGVRRDVRGVVWATLKSAGYESGPIEPLPVDLWAVLGNLRFIFAETLRSLVLRPKTR
jgi:hypothetical protein